MRRFLPFAAFILAYAAYLGFYGQKSVARASASANERAKAEAGFAGHPNADLFSDFNAHQQSAKLAQASAGAAATSTATSGKIVVEGQGGFILELDGSGGGRLTRPGSPDLTLAGSAAAPELRDAAKKVLYRFERTADGMGGKLLEADGTTAWVITEDRTRDEIIATVEATGRVVRVKHKDGTFNVYEGATRIGKGKVKGDRIEIREPEGTGRLGAIEGESSMTAAALLALPVEPQFRVLLWKASSGR